MSLKAHFLTATSKVLFEASFLVEDLSTHLFCGALHLTGALSRLSRTTDGPSIYFDLDNPQSDEIPCASPGLTTKPSLNPWTRLQANTAGRFLGSPTKLHFLVPKSSATTTPEILTGLSECMRKS